MKRWRLWGRGEMARRKKQSSKTGDRQQKGRWFRDSSTGGASGTRCRAAAGRLAEMGTPDVVIGLGVDGAEILSPHDIVGGIDDAIVVVIAGQRHSHDPNLAGVRVVETVSRCHRAECARERTRVSGNGVKTARRASAEN